MAEKMARDAAILRLPQRPISSRARKSCVSPAPDSGGLSFVQFKHTRSDKGRHKGCCASDSYRALPFSVHCPKELRRFEIPASERSSPFAVADIAGGSEYPGYLTLIKNPITPSRSNFATVALFPGKICGPHERGEERRRATDACNTTHIEQHFTATGRQLFRDVKPKQSGISDGL